MFDFLRKIIHLHDAAAASGPVVPICYASSIVYSMFEDPSAAEILSDSKTALPLEHMAFYENAASVLSATVW